MGVQRRVKLAPERESARAARQLLREAVLEAGRQEWLDSAELALSEVVTNAMLHAHTDIDVVVEVSESAVCVEVRDYDRTLPVQRHYGEEAVTGRGMALVAAVTQQHGVESLGDAGKVVWFRVGETVEEPSVDELLEAWAIDLDEPLEPPAASTTVVLQAMPVRLWMAAREHHDGLVRELCHHIAAQGELAGDVDVAAADRSRSTISATLASAIGGGDSDPAGWPEALDLELSVAPDAGASFAAMQDTLDVGESLAIDGQLLLQPGLPEIVAVRDWACEQIIAQLLDAPPSPWPGTAQERFETEVRDQRGAKSDWDSSAVTEASAAVIAADRANRIVAVSPAAAELLGWDADHLIGRRVVTIVPPAWRERHVAGFSRHVSTGQSRVLGAELELPVLTATGTEVPCRIRIDRLGGTGSRTVYAAWIEPTSTG